LSGAPAGGRYAKLFGASWRSEQLAGLPAATERLYYRALSYCADNLTDGHITLSMVLRLGGRHYEAARLVKRGLWLATDQPDAWTDSSYALGAQRTRAQVEADRYAARDRQDRARRRARGEA
jgi:hypothetical protein